MFETPRLQLARKTTLINTIREHRETIKRLRAWVFVLQNFRAAYNTKLKLPMLALAEWRRHNQTTNPHLDHILDSVMAGFFEVNRASEGLDLRGEE
jgi:hypothetical protein